jgi:hypothetical protein
MLVIDAKGLQRLSQALQALPGQSEQACMRAVNYAARKARTDGSKRIRQQVALKANYVNENLRLDQLATPSRLSARISARHRPVRLARFSARQLVRSAPSARGDSLRGISAGRRQAGVSVRVKPGAGQVRRMRRAFLVPLRRGKMPGDATSFGVFIRTGPGRGDIKHLYGPSINQVFWSVREDLEPGIRRDLASEYARQMRLLTQRGR